MKPTITQVLKHLLFLLIVNLPFHLNSNAQSTNVLNLNIGKDTLLPLKQSSPTEITLTTNLTTSVLSFNWTQTEGPSVSLQSPISGSVTISGLSVGKYSFKCIATDGINIGIDSINIKVVDYQKKNQIPCRTGAPRIWTLSPTSTKDLIRPYLRRDGFDIQGGDTIKINRNPNNGGVYSYFYLGDFGGAEGCPVVVVPNGKIVEIGGPGQRWHIGKNLGATSDTCFVNNVIFDGTYLRNQGIMYGFQNTGESWGISANLVTDLEIKGCLFQNNSLGIQLKLYSDSTYPWTVYDNFQHKNIKIHDNYFQNVRGGEGFYIGSTDLSGSNQGGNSGNQGPTVRGDTCLIYNNFLDSTGWDAIQVSSMRYTEIHDNIVLNSATKNQSSQNWGILLGGNCTGKIYNNVVYKGTSATVGTLGYGPTEIFYNYIDSTSGNGIYADMKNNGIIEASTPTLWPALKVNIHHNMVSRPGSQTTARAIKNQNNEGTSVPGSIQHNYILNDNRAVNDLIYSGGVGDIIANNSVIPYFPVTMTPIGSSSIGPLIRVVQGNGVDSFAKAKDIIDWLFGRLTGAPLPNYSPVAKAGVDQSINLPIVSTTLDGSGSLDPDGSIVSYQWSKISGPIQFSISSALQVQTVINNLNQGVYLFELKVTDNLGAVSKDTIKITVNAALPVNQLPKAIAGVDQTIILPLNTVDLNATSSFDPDGNIVAYLWNKISGPVQYNISSPSQVLTTANNLTGGIYLFELTITDDSGASSKDTIQVTVNPSAQPVNQMPIAYAGSDQILTLPNNSCFLNGSSSTDPDGNITSYLWTKLSGPTQFNIVSSTAAQTQVNNFIQGIYYFELIVTDNSLGISKDTVRIIVNSAPPPTNEPPVAKAGTDQSITLPVNNLHLNGSSSFDPDGTISSYLWVKISGPAQINFVSPDQSQTGINNLSQGIYKIELIVTDNSGASSRDTIQINVNAAPPQINQPPVARAGLDQIITLPVYTANLNGQTSYDADGTIISYNWSKISGSGPMSIINGTQPLATFNSIIPGIYKIELMVTDNVGAIAKDTMQIIVYAPPADGNQLPTANAGNNLEINLPQNYVTLVGSGSDPDGTITSFEWVKISGPSEFNIVSPSLDKTIVNNLVAGTYQFQLKVTDNKGASGTSVVQITVYPKKQSTAYVYPNPAVSVINIEINSITHSNKSQLYIYNEIGVLIYKEEFMRNQAFLVKQVDISKFPSGAYIIYLNIDINYAETLKFIKL